MRSFPVPLSPWSKTIEASLAELARVDGPERPSDLALGGRSLRDRIAYYRDDGTTALTYDSVGLNCIMQTGTGSTTTGKSAYVIDTNTDPPDADASNMLFILGLSNIVGNEIGAYGVWDVLINQHRYRPNNGLGVA